MAITRIGLVALLGAAAPGLSAVPAQASGGSVQLHVHAWEPLPSPYVVLPPRVVYQAPVVYHHYDRYSWRSYRRRHYGHWHGHHRYRAHASRSHPYGFIHGHSGHRRHR